MNQLLVKREGEFTYPILFETDFEKLGESCRHLDRSLTKICIITDTNVSQLYLKNVQEQLLKIFSYVTCYVIPAGEENKTLDQIQGIYTHLIEEHFDRKDLLLALGGGVVGDMTGYTAATYLRGIDFIQIPTTLLAQVDSSIGGKTGVDFKCYKNMIGAFHQPILVYMNVNTLNTLSAELFSSGMAEVVKYGLIRDYSYYAWLVFHKKEILSKEPKILCEMIYRSCMNKKIIVEVDPKEQGERALLNMGHTIGHAVEKLKNFTWLHGQCVALGIIASSYISFQRGYLTAEEFQKVQKDLRTFGLPLRISGLDAKEVLEATKSDKKMENGRIRFILMEKLGHAAIAADVTDEELLDAITLIEEV